MHVLLAGFSTRAAAESAARAGFTVTAIDAFGDLDQHPSVHALLLPRGFTAQAAARLARGIACDASAYLSAFENHPRAVAALAAGRALWGNPPHVLRRVRDPLILARALRSRGCAAPEVYVAGPNMVRPASDQPDQYVGRGLSAPPASGWLVKPLASGGGHGVQPWIEGVPLPRGHYLQQPVDGTPGSVVFVAAAGRAVPLGVTSQLVGEAAFGAERYRYCGSILAAPAASDPTLVERACALAAVVADEFGLVGVNGIDFVAREGVPSAIEVNPRWCASMELVELAYQLSVFGAHATACTDGALPDFDVSRARCRWGAIGKAVVFARRDVTIGDSRAWLPGSADRDEVAIVRDVPHPGDRIAAGRPVCTVFATGPDAAACRAALVRRAERVYAQLEQSTIDNWQWTRRRTNRRLVP
jgi:predicted ATP-grasp superfamily ATP-dependent carboligase